jgi:hypothetical protein
MCARMGRSIIMADQQSRGGKKVGHNAQPGQREQHQATHRPDVEKQGQRPAEGQHGGPKPSAGKSRPEHHK